MAFYSDEYFEDLKMVVDKNLNFLKELNGQSVLITGATGLIGSAIVDLLICLNEVYNLQITIIIASRDDNKTEQRFAPYGLKKYMQLVHYDAAMPLSFQIEKLDYIIHSAGNAHPVVIEHEPVETMETNIIGLLNLLKFTEKSQTKRLVYISSSEIYGNRVQEKNKLYVEDEYGYVDLLNPRSCYPSSKRAAETLLVSYVKEYGIDANIVRPGHIYGPTQTESDSRASAQFLKASVLGSDILMKSAGVQMRSYCHCFDCASAILTVMLKGKKGEAYNISNPNSIVTICDFASECARVAGTKIIFEKADENERKSYNMMFYSALNSEKLERLGWKGAYNLQSGVEESIRHLGQRKYIE